MQRFNLSQFIKDHVIFRQGSFFQEDISKNKTLLEQEIKGKSVLVIGGAGTIGSSFIKALLPFHPHELTVVDYSENGLTELTRDLRSSETFVPPNFKTYPFDFGGSVFSKLYKSQNWDIVACFAAHKHVRSEKDHLAIEAMINNNVFNTERLIKLALENKPKHFFSVSTDKAANPVNVMGASKKVMEKVLMAYSDELKICTARFANVAFSNGSLLDGYFLRMTKNQPLVAPTDIKRYFVSPEESGQICLLACILGNSGEIFFPKLKEEQMITFATIAKAFIEKHNLQYEICTSEKDAKIKAKKLDVNSKTYPLYLFSSDTSGEKEFEEFFTKTDDVNNSRFEGLGVIQNKVDTNKDSIQKMLFDFEQLFKNNQIDKQQVVDKLSDYLHDFSHKETGKSLDEKM